MASSNQSKLNKIMENVLDLEKQISDFQGEKDSKEYKFLDEELTRKLIALDKIEADNVRQQRKESIDSINNLVSILESKTKTNQAENLESKTKTYQAEKSSKQSPRNSPTTKFKQLGFVFGSQLTDFDKGQ